MQVKILTTKLKQYLYFCHYFSTSTFHSREKNSPYDILGVNPSSSFNDIKKAYHNLSKIYHPDKNQSHDASEKFKTINNAYNTLKEYHEESNNYKQNKNSKPYEQRNNQKCYNTSPNQTKEDKTSNRSFYKTEAEDLYEKIFGKSYSSDPMAYYSPENFELRKEYEEKLKKIKEKKKEREEKNHETMRQGFENQQKYYHHEEDQKNIKLDPLFWIVSGGASLIVFFLVFWSVRKKNLCL